MFFKHTHLPQLHNSFSIMSDTLLFSELHDEMHNRAQHSVRRHLEGKKYIPAKVSEWVDAINNEVIEEAKKISSNFKYVVNCVIHQQAGAGMHSSTVTHWDAKHDCSVMVRFETLVQFHWTKV